MNEVALQPIVEHKKDQLIFNKNRPSWEDAERIAFTLNQMKDAIDIWIGDAALRFSQIWPDIHHQLWRERYDDKTIDNYIRVAKKIPPPRRRGLTAGVIEAASWLETEEEQDEAIETAKVQKLTVKEAQTLVNKMKGRKPKEKPIKYMFCVCPECNTEFKTEILS